MVGIPGRALRTYETQRCERTGKYGDFKSSQTKWWSPCTSDWGKEAENEAREFGGGPCGGPCSLRGLQRAVNREKIWSFLFLTRYKEERNININR